LEIYIVRRTKSSDLMIALKIEQLEVSDHKQKITFIRNLYKNDLTRKMLNEYEKTMNQETIESKLLKNSWIKNISKACGFDKYDPVKIIEALTNRIDKIKTEEINNRKTSVIETLVKCFNFYTTVNKYLVETLIKIEFSTKGGVG